LLYPTGQVYSISCGPDGDVLLLANNGIFNVHADQFTAIPPIPGARPFGIFQVVATPDHELYASLPGLEFTGVWRYTRGAWTKFTDPGVPSPYTEYVDSRGRLWTGNRYGLIGLPLEAGGRMLSSGDPGLGIVFAILETSHGVFAGGLNGLAVSRGDRFETLSFADDISSLGVGGLVEAANGDLWLNASRGIVRIRSNELQTALMTPNYAMHSEVFTEGEFVGPVALNLGKSTAARDSEGNLWFATMNGIFHIDPEHLTSGDRLPNLSIRSVTVDQKPVANGGSIEPGAETLGIRYLGVNLTTPESVTYKYKLDGLDDAWQDAGHRAQAIYTHLRPGRYTFRVMASNGDGAWTEPVSSASFSVRPRVYQTKWFLVVCAAAVLALFWALYYLRLRQLQKRHEALNRSRLELAHLARLATLSTMTASITHEVSQPISGILTNCNTCARFLTADPPNVGEAVETVRRTIRDAERASEVIKRLRAMFAKKAPAMGMIDLNEATREVIAMSSDELRRSGAVLQTDFAEPLPAISGDRVQLQQVILNLLLNAADAMAGIEDRARTLRVQTELEGSDSVKLLVRDSGIGLDPHAIEKLFEAFHTTKAHGLGIGLAISRSIIESHQGRLWAMANDGPGATFGFSIPCFKSVVEEPAAIRSPQS
jgi:signal transduction histidine kinase